MALKNRPGNLRHHPTFTSKGTRGAQCVVLFAACAFMLWCVFVMTYSEDNTTMLLKVAKESLPPIAESDVKEQKPSVLAIAESEYEVELARLTAADPNQKTLAFAPLHFYSGFVNEVMAFAAFIMKAHDDNYTQILLPSFRWKDIFATNNRIPHEKLFDAVHWNKNYATPKSKNDERPPLPRFVVHHPSMTNYDPRNNKWMSNYDPRENKWIGDSRNTTLLGAFGKQANLFGRYRGYRKRSKERHRSDLAILRGAFRPHPDLQKLIEEAKGSMAPSQKQSSISSMSSSSSPPPGYMCLHPRVEPDMQKHPVCRDLKVVSLEKIINDLYKEFPTPPVSRVLIVLYRKLLEVEDPQKNELAGQNLALLNKLRNEGMWNGTVPVYEAGSHFLPKDSFFGQKASSIAGSILNYNLALDADIFVGTVVSSFAMQVMATRYNRNNTCNYIYLPHGIKKLPPNEEPPYFKC